MLIRGPAPFTWGKGGKACLLIEPHRVNLT